MIKKLRLKFVLIGMLAVTVVTFALIFSINLADSIQVFRALDNVIEELIESDTPPGNSGTMSSLDDVTEFEEGNTVSSGTISLLEGLAHFEGEKTISSGDDPNFAGRNKYGSDRAGLEESSSENDPYFDEHSKEDTEKNDAKEDDIEENDSAENAAEESGSEEGWKSHKKKNGKWGRHSAVSQYLSRFFSVLIRNNSAYSVRLENQTFLTEEEAVDLAKRALDSGKEKGTLDEYRFLVLSGSNASQVCFLDCSTELSTLKNLRILSAIIGIAGVLLSFFFIYFMSGKIIKPVKESIEKQKQFITDAGHELKTPLSVIGTNLDILEMDLGENEWVTGIRKQTRKLRKLVENLIALSRMSEAQTDLLPQKFSLTEAAGEAVDMFRIQAEAKGETIEEQIEENLFTEGDETSIRQLFSILCDNAVKYSAGEGAIHVRLYSDGKKVMFETINSWDHSIPTDQLDRVFDRFYRGSASRDRSKGEAGYGLGLSIAKAIAEKNHIQIKVTETEEGRLLFRVTLKQTKG